ncbi:3-deoxy-D-manno-octulosonic acid transferase [Roseovarius spongiae]|uniref:3-deoxy-D-manno-octulosonic acid transferase n=1 Tax=Roseovarius spongiae TaxID=2320272 RepID=A0A3A8ATP4_9RHOB|nr:3-deoxy-D-manno-octulosonic acid transferase [Roseovarius spongiae]RKF14979.1 3-deoxy-D-manno-octulosonic acid transferase [Roseovarius spongiae]
MSTPLPVTVYARLAGVLAPLTHSGIRAKMAAQKVDAERFSEKLGHASLPRPEGPLLWFHAASVGESLSVLRLISLIGARAPGLGFLITTGTATSAQILATRLPPRCRHQFAPLDTRRAVERFLDHWRPDAAVFVESELWPNMLTLTAARGVPMALLNARISERSARGWKRVPATARHLLGLFGVIHTQDARTTRHMHEIGATHARTGRNIKAASGPLPHDADALAQIRAALGDRPVWVASSTHPGEEEIVLDAHRALLDDHPRLLLILVPRHPERGDRVQSLIRARGLTLARRSAGEQPGAGTQVYLADTLGETGLWYAASPLVCLGGSFTPVGGHNPYEPAHAGAVVLHGPLYANFSDAYADFAQAGGAVEVADGAALREALDALLKDADRLAGLRDCARAFAAAQEDMLEAQADTLLQALGLGEPEPLTCPS